MATQPQTTYTYEDLKRDFPVDNIRREIIGGELIVSSSPTIRHQRVVGTILRLFLEYEDAHGGIGLTAPMDTYFGEIDVVQPDVMFITEVNRADRTKSTIVRGAPDVAVEISSPSTRRLELVRKLELYQRYGVPEYWYVDLDADRIEVYRLADGRYGKPEQLWRGDTLRSVVMPGFSCEVDHVLGDSEED